MKETFLVTVFDLDNQLFSGEVMALSSTNQSGPFDILGLHANFISEIQGSVVLHLNGRETKEIPIESGLVRCLETQVSVYIVKKSASEPTAKS